MTHSTADSPVPGLSPTRECIDGAGEHLNTECTESELLVDDVSMESERWKSLAPYSFNERFGCENPRLVTNPSMRQVLYY